MIALMWLLASAACGIAVGRRWLEPWLDRVARVAGGVLTGWIVAAWLAYGTLVWPGRLSPFTLAVQTAVFAAVTWWLRRTPVAVPPGGRDRDRRPGASALALVALVLPVAALLFGTHWYAGLGVVVPPGSVDADATAWHMAAVAALAGGDPDAARQLLTQPLLADVHQAALVVGGLDAGVAGLVTGVGLVAVLVVLLHALAFEVTGRLRAAWLAVGLTLLNGGFGFVGYLERWRQGGLPLRTFLQSHTESLVGAMQYVNLLSGALLTQRPVLYGLPVIVFVLVLVARWWQIAPSVDAAADVGSSGRLLVVAGALLGMLPFLHPLGWLACAVVVPLWALLRPHRAWIGFAALAIAPAVPQMTALGMAGCVSPPWLLPGWLAHGVGAAPLFWLRAVGVPVLVAVPAWRSLASPWRRFLLPFVGVWAMGVTVMVTRNPAANLAVLQVVDAVNAVVLAGWLVALSEPPARQRLLPIVLAATAMASGGLDLYHAMGASSSKPLLADDAAAAFLREHVPTEALFLAAPGGVPSVRAGRPCLGGFPDVPGSAGSASDTVADVRAIYAADWNAKALIAKHRIDFIYLGETERRLYGADTQRLAGQFPVVYDRLGVIILQARPVAAPSPASRS